MPTSFALVADRLEPAALELFSTIVELHQGGSGDRRFVYGETYGGSFLTFVAHEGQRELNDVDGGALRELARYGLLTTGRAGRNLMYRVNREGLAFHRWWRQQQGQAIAQTEHAVTTLLASEAFAQSHHGAAHHLNQAFDLLWQNRSDEQTISEIGDHLRKALMDVTTDVVGSDVVGGTERPDERLQAWLAARNNLHHRERDVLLSFVDLVDRVLRLDHRLNHVRDEVDRNEPPPSRGELRRAAFLTATVCYEIAQLSAQHQVLR